MAGKGLYGVFYKKCTKVGGVTTGYEGTVALMGKAIAATFTPNTPEENPLYANNSIAENDTSSGAGGTLTLTLDRMTLEVAADLYGTTVKDVSVQVGEETVSGKEIEYLGLETSAAIGTAYIKLHQEDGVPRHEVMFYREASFTRPEDSARTMEGSVEWQTPEVSGNIMGMQGNGSEPWFRVSSWPSQEAAIAYIYQLFGEEASAAAINHMMDELTGGEDDEEVGV